jgi:hypothetical protein
VFVLGRVRFTVDMVGSIAVLRLVVKIWSLQMYTKGFVLKKRALKMIKIYVHKRCNNKNKPQV